MAKSYTEITKTNIAGLSIVVNNNDELQITGSYKGNPISQTVATPLPAMIFVDPVNNNLIAVRIDGIDPTWELVATVEKIVNS